ncbi:MAG: polyprenyl diphosphate synthase [Candidatus Thermoplasmatota archaeon]|jgi:tritrans,polycis-undecaprenyl-diphosphate synthase [geranylgeranyl-diphosphate specific]|nr:polyprenyl diphosphate synthase [Candidatus Thermoplasmatota archaeon]MCL5800115.1 polyprenyl diphosphate synthase [Candidatus Thermoplasmatota archaeon]
MATIGEKLGDLAVEVYEKVLMDEIAKAPIPSHLAIITDGNRRYARGEGLPEILGHVKGKEKLEEVLEWCRDIGIKIVTVYAFSTENFSRTKREVDFLMDLIEKSLNDLLHDQRIVRNEINIRVLGKIEQLPQSLRNAIDKVENFTKDYSKFRLNLAIGYGGRTEIVDAVRRISEKVRSGELALEEISEETFRGFLYDPTIPDPDLVFRTSGEERVSNFLLWQSAYSELYFCEVNWPELKKIDLLRAVQNYQQRKRRFGH